MESSKKISKSSLIQYIKEQVENLHKIHILKEQKEKVNKDLKKLNEESEYSEKAKEFISKKMSKMADEDKSQSQKLAIAMNMARKKGLKVPKDKKK